MLGCWLDSPSAFVEFSHLRSGELDLWFNKDDFLGLSSIIKQIWNGLANSQRGILDVFVN